MSNPPVVVAIGDSATQGFQSGAIFRTDWSYPAMVARALQLNIPGDFRVPSFPLGGMPLNLEQLMRFLQSRLGPDISLGEWALVPFLLSEYLHPIEEYYERGVGSLPGKSLANHHNLAVWGFRVADALDVTTRFCAQAISKAEGWLDDDFLGTPSGAMYRTAMRVLEPSMNPAAHPERNQVEVLAELVREKGVDVLFLGLGRNDCLGTVTDLKIRDMKGHEAEAIGLDPEGRRKWNLTSPEVFEADYKRVVQAIQAALGGGNTKVLVETIPKLTILPVARGHGSLVGNHFETYTRFFISQDDPHRNYARLTRAEAAFIDERIEHFNAIIRASIPADWKVLDVSDTLDQLAVRRNGFGDDPSQALREYYARKGITNHPLLHLNPIPSVLMYNTDRGGSLTSGGLFSLDGVHPTTLGYGIIAEEALRCLGADTSKLPWANIIGNDSLWQLPPAIWSDILRTADHHSGIWDAIFRILSQSHPSD